MTCEMFKRRRPTFRNAAKHRNGVEEIRGSFGKLLSKLSVGTFYCVCSTPFIIWHKLTISLPFNVSALVSANL